MDDRVGDVLNSRSAALQRGAAPSVLLSLALHGALAGAAFYVALHTPQPEAASVLNIRFKPLPASPSTAAPPTKTPATTQPPATIPPEAAAKVPKMEIPVTTNVPAEKVPPKDAVPLSNFGRSTKRGSDAVVPPPAIAQPAVPGIAAAADVPVGGSGVTGLDGGDFPYTIYIDNMKRLVGTRWFRPQFNGGAATIYFALDRDGSIRDARVETTSGNATFDRSALRAVIESSPLPPLPFGYSGTFLGVHLTFK